MIDRRSFLTMVMGSVGLWRGEFEAAEAVRQRTGWGVNVYNTKTYRMNVTLVTANLPDAVWDSPEFLGEGDFFGVQVWRLRDGVANREYKIPVWKASLQTVVTPIPQAFRKGDLFVVEYSPGLLRAPGVPFASLIDNTSGDPTTIPMVEMVWTVPEKKRRSAR